MKWIILFIIMLLAPTVVTQPQPPTTTLPPTFTEQVNQKLLQLDTKLTAVMNQQSDFRQNLIYDLNELASQNYVDMRMKEIEQRLDAKPGGNDIVTWLVAVNTLFFVIFLGMKGKGVV